MILLLINSLYILFQGLLLCSWKRISGFGSTHTHHFTTASILIAVRNESANILKLLNDLEKQSYDKTLWEVIIIDDHSTDNTPDLVRAFAEKSSFSLQLLELRLFLPDYFPEENFKKQALSLGVSKATGELIFTTDGDCRVGPQWIETFVAFYEKTNAKCITSAVKFSDETSLFEKLQSIEFGSLIGTGAATLQWGLPAMSNGANLAYPKWVFEKLNGYTGTATTPSGDDVFWVQKIYKYFPEEVYFLKSKEAIVSTKAQPDLVHFFRQRIRWASKWHLYHDFKISGLALFMFIAQVAGLLTIGAMFYKSSESVGFFYQFFIRFCVEFVFLATTARYFSKTRIIWVIPFVQILYPFYAIFLGIAVLFRKEYEWKGRRIKV
jgi:glycosyltransferase involved in cell wall biosynthesis